MKVAILGAPHTGKTELTHALSVRLSIQGLAHEIVDSAPLESISPLDVVLLCGLDLAAATPAQLQADQTIRQTLAEHALSFQVVYGQGKERFTHALYAAAQRAQALGLGALAAHMRQTQPVRWTGACENCADADCEHQLFSQLLAKK